MTFHDMMRYRRAATPAGTGTRQRGVNAEFTAAANLQNFGVDQVFQQGGPAATVGAYRIYTPAGADVKVGDVITRASRGNGELIINGDYTVRGVVRRRGYLQLNVDGAT